MSSYLLSNHTATNDTTILSVDVCTQEILCRFVEQQFFTESAPRDSIYADLSTYNDLAWLWVCFAFYTPLCLFGIIGNTTTIVLFTKFIKRTNTSIFIIALAVVDLVVCAIPLPIWLYQLFHYRIFSDIICRLDKFLLYVASPMSALILLVIAVDRFLLICLKKNTITPFRAKAIVAAIAILCVGLATPELLVYTTIHRVEPEFCPEIYFCNLGVCSDTEYIMLRWTYLRLTFVSYAIFALAFLVIPFLYSLIFVRVYRMYKTMSQWRNNSSDGSHCNTNGKSAKTLAVEEDHLTFASAADEQNNSTVTMVAEQSKANNINERQNLVKSASSKKKPKKKLPHFRTAVTLLLVTVIFAITYGPTNIIMLVAEIKYASRNPNSEPDVVQEELKRNSALYFLYHLIFLNHVANPIIYAFLNPRVKEILKKMAHKMCAFRHSGGGGGGGSS